MRRRRAQTARTALLWGLAGFVVLQLGLAVLIERWLPALRDPDYTQKVERLHERLTGPRRPPTVVMLGSSRTAFGLDGSPVEQDLAARLGQQPIIFNFGMWGAGPTSHLVTLHRLLDEGIRPDLVLIEVLPTFLAEGDGEKMELSRLTPDRLSLHDVKMLEQSGIPTEELESEWWPERPFASYTHRYAIINQLLSAYLPQGLRVEWANNQDRTCFVPLMRWGNAAAVFSAGLERAWREHGSVLQSFHLGGASAAALRQTLELCRREHLRAALVLMPEGSEFRRWYSRRTQRQLSAYLHELHGEYEVAVIDARTWSRDGDFSDSHHLLPEGAHAFSLRLGREAILPLLRTEPTWNATLLPSPAPAGPAPAPGADAAGPLQ